MSETIPIVAPRNKGGRPRGSRNKPKPPEIPTVRPRYLQVAGACRYCGVSTSTMRRWIRTGTVRSAKIGSVVLVAIDSLDALADGGRRA